MLQQRSCLGLTSHALGTVTFQVSVDPYVFLDLDANGLDRQRPRTSQTGDDVTGHWPSVSRQGITDKLKIPKNFSVRLPDPDFLNRTGCCAKTTLQLLRTFNRFQMLVVVGTIFLRRGEERSKAFNVCAVFSDLS